jgi:hypothetical protein
LLLEAYHARRNGDYRKAIIEAATALEICLSNCAKRELSTQGISFGAELLRRKFRMLSGRFELVRLLGIALPQKDYDKLIVKPRNEVIHLADFPSNSLSNRVIAEVEELLRLLSPQLHEDVKSPTARERFLRTVCRFIR